MALNVQRKEEVCKEYGRGKKDTGSVEVQVALYTSTIDDLTPHFEKHPKDRHSRRGLLRMVARRRKLLDYLKRKDEMRYKVLVKRLGLRR